MATESIEDVVVKLEADYSDFLKQIDRAVEEAVRKLKDVDEAPKKARSAWADLGNFLKNQFLPIAASIVAAFAVQNVVSFFTGITKAAVDANAQFETFKVQFETLLGSATAASERIKELAAFGQATPFELPEIVEADRLLQTFGGTALATGENLRRVGDSAAAVNANFQEVAFWTGRLYSAIQAGRPFGEAAARLSELGILSGDTRTKMEDLQKAGVEGAEIWELYASTVDTKFAGAMDKLSKTFQGVMSNIADFQGMLLREGGESFFEGLRQDAIEFFDIINQPQAKEDIIALAESFGKIADELREAITSPILASLQEVEAENVRQLAASIGDFAEGLGRLANIDINNINGLIDSLKGMVDLATGITNAAAALRDWSMVVSGIKPLQDILGDVPLPFFMITEAIGNAIEHEKELETTGSHALNALQRGAQLATDRAKELAGAVEEVDEAAVAAAGALDKISLDFADAVDANNEKIEELNIEHGKTLGEIEENNAERKADIIKSGNKAILELEEDVAKQREDIAEKTAEALADLEKDTTKRRAEINEQTSEQLAELENSTQESIAEVREEHQKKEKRETEEHQRDMKRLEENYLFDLQDAVTNRDARAIVDLRRRFQKEKQERERDFKDKKQNDSSDLENRVEEIRKNEQERRTEILKAQRKQLADLAEHEAERRQEIAESEAEQLANLAEHEAERRQEIAESMQEQLAKAEEQHQEQIARENERYAERKSALDEALAKRLEDVAKELSDEKDINEEGAKAILETLNKFFGVGGDIDKLMEEFAARRKQKMTIQIGFENEMAGLDDTDMGTPNQRGSMGPPRFQLGGIVPGPIGKPKRIIAHGGEEIVPVNEVARLNQMRQGLGAGGGEMRVKLDISGSAPPGIRSGEIEAMAGMMIDAFEAAGIRARR